MYAWGVRMGPASHTVTVLTVTSISIRPDRSSLASQLPAIYIAAHVSLSLWDDITKRHEQSYGAPNVPKFKNMLLYIVWVYYR